MTKIKVLGVRTVGVRALDGRWWSVIDQLQRHGDGAEAEFVIAWSLCRGVPDRRTVYDCFRTAAEAYTPGGYMHRIPAF